MDARSGPCGDRRQCIERASQLGSAIDGSPRASRSNGYERNQHDEENERENEDTPRCVLGPHLERRREQAGIVLGGDELGLRARCSENVTGNRVVKPLTVKDESPHAPVVSEVTSAATKFARARRNCDGDRHAVLLKVGHVRVAVHARQEECDRENGQGYNDEGDEDPYDLSSIDLYGRAAQHGDGLVCPVTGSVIGYSGCIRVATTRIDRQILASAKFGQAASYTVGRCEIEQLPNRTAKRLGERFAVRYFYDLVLRTGPVVLAALASSEFN